MALNRCSGRAVPSAVALFELLSTWGLETPFRLVSLVHLGAGVGKTSGLRRVHLVSS